MASGKKRRLYSDEYIKYGFTSININKCTELKLWRKTLIGVAPRAEIPPHMWSLGVCPGILITGFCPFVHT